MPNSPAGRATLQPNPNDYYHVGAQPCIGARQPLRENPKKISMKHLADAALFVNARHHKQNPRDRA
jgi:hypothetical protein